MTAGRAVIVCRVSNDEQAGEDRTSLDTQERECRAWCERYGLDVVDVVREEGVPVSGPLDRTVSPRPFWTRAWDRLATRDVQAVVFWRPTRFSRDANALRAGAVIESSRQYGLGIVFADQPPPSPGDDSQVASFLHAWASGQDAKNRRDATMKGVSAKWASGQWASGTPPMGYARTTEARKLAVDEAQATLVREAFRLYLDGLGVGKIATRLNEAGVLSPSRLKHWNEAKVAHTAWTSGTVARLLHRDYSSTTYVRTFGGREYSFTVEPLISRETWQRVDELRTTRDRIRRGSDATWSRVPSAQPERTGNLGLCQGRVLCGRCGRRLRTGYSTRRRLVSYYCPATLVSRRKPTDEPCDARRWLASEVDALVWRAARAALASGEALQGAADAYVDRLEAQIATANPEVARTHAELGALRTERERTVDAEIKYGVDRAEDIADLDRRIAALDEALRERSRETAQLDRLRDERQRVRGAIARYGGAFTLGADDPDDPGTARLEFRREREPADRVEGGLMVGLGWLSRGVDVRQRTAIVDELGLVVTAFDDRLEVEGAVRAVLPLSPPPA